jgi:hypothetical protein
MRSPALPWRLTLAALALLPALACSQLARPEPVATEPPEASLAAPTGAALGIVPPTGIIQGMLWHEICEFTGGEAGEAVVLGKGCVQWGENPGDFGPNQVRDEFESGWPGVLIHLGAGACPSTGLADMRTTVDGSYVFANLEAGTYCVSYSPTADGNDSVLIPGGPTFPSRDESGVAQTVDVAAGEIKQVDFGYAWQFYD